MVGHRVKSVIGQPAGDPLGALARKAVDDAGLAGMFAANEFEQLASGVGARLDAVAQVGPVETGAEGRAAIGEQRLGDLGARAGLGGRGQGDARQIREALGKLPELEILRPEIVAPLRDAMRLVNGDQRQRAGLEQGEGTRLHQALRGNVEQIQPAAAQVVFNRAPAFGAQRGVEDLGAHAIGLERLDLVAHQGDQRRDDDTRAGAHQRRNLVAKRFAAPGGHQHQRIAACNQRLDDFALAAAKIAESEDLAQDPAGRVPGRLAGRCAHASRPSSRAARSARSTRCSSARSMPSDCLPNSGQP